MNNVPIEMIMGNEASTDILDNNTFGQSNNNNENALEPTAKCLFTYGSADHRETMGKFTGTFSFESNQKHNVLIHVLKGNNGSLLSDKWCEISLDLTRNVSCKNFWALLTSTTGSFTMEQQY